MPSHMTHTTTPLAGPPRATVRLQFHAGYTLDDAVAQVPYFAALGISHVYASPLLAARAGSRHGYDGVDPARVNPELGGEPALRRLAAELHAHGLGLILDIVPNHMAASTQNPWWEDVLTWGTRSRHAHWFDIDWQPQDPALHGKVLLPVLGRPYGEALDAGELSLALDAARGRLQLAYFERRFPLSPVGHAELLRALAGPPPIGPGAGRPAAKEPIAGATPPSARAEPGIPIALGLSQPAPADGDASGGHASLTTLARRFDEAAAQGGPAAVATFEQASAALAAALQGEAGLRPSLEAALARHAADPAALHALLERQCYRLACWRTASDEINWRRFFDVHELVGMNVERPEVFDALHATLLRLVGDGLIDGLRVDHVDGLADPGAYCRQLREQVMRRWPHDPSLRPFYLVVEKILAQGEALRADWAVDGSTGYDFMNQVSEWLHQPAGEAPLGALWAEVSGRSAGFEPEALAARRELVGRSFSAQLEATVAALHAVARGALATRDTSAASIRRALLELLAHFPVYRTYAAARGQGLDAAGERHLHQAAAHASRSCRRDDAAVPGLLARWLGGAPGAAPHASRLAVRRFQQLTAPLAAKAVEDTAFYRHGRLLSRNDVGFDPAVFAGDGERLHQRCAERRRHFPLAMLASATHDHKRGEDLRARLAVLSECPQDWERLVLRWRSLNAALRGPAGAPGAGDEAMLYQMLAGAWPVALAPSDATGLAAFRDRIWRWQEKALHEAKLATDWIAPDTAHEAACKSFLEALLDPAVSQQFLGELHGFVARIDPPGKLNGLVQTLLKCTVPGVPDLYQGAEYWDLSLVDPDNRRPVDFASRAASLDRVRATPLADLLPTWQDGVVKQALIARLLACRAAAPRLFAQGDYRPLPVRGPQAARVLAFERRLGAQRLLVVATRWPAGTAQAGGAAGGVWRETQLVLEDGGGAPWRDVLAGPLADAAAAKGLPALGELLQALPFAVHAVL
jgi:(1->4)-alpha-D-glucan 1-alpha-D-glucosylmutase